MPETKSRPSSSPPSNTPPIASAATTSCNSSTPPDPSPPADSASSSVPSPESVSTFPAPLPSTPRPSSTPQSPHRSAESPKSSSPPPRFPPKTAPPRSTPSSSSPPRSQAFDTVYKVGGAQAIAALAYGTESIASVDKIFGPGNRFVTAAKRRLYGVVGIDAIYGPTETLIVADHTANPELVAADLLAQAEHDNLAAPILIATSESLAEAVVTQLLDQTIDLPRRDIALNAVRNRGGLAFVPDLDDALAIANEYAPEHLALVVENAQQRIGDVRNAGGLFVGEASPEALGDYVAGPSHVMPTGGSARFASALNVGEFMKITTVVQVTDELLDEVSADAELIAHAEHLDAHARSLERRRRDR